MINTRPPARPIVHCLAAPAIRDRYGMDDGTVRLMPIVVSLETALWLSREYGWWMCGPDPHDMIALDAWQREQEPFNPALDAERVKRPRRSA